MQASLSVVILTFVSSTNNESKRPATFIVFQDQSSLHVLQIMAIK